MSTPQPPAGWYPDPDSGQQRYWDGQQWTGNYAPTVAPVKGNMSTGAKVGVGLAVLLLFGGCVAVLGSSDEPKPGSGDGATTEAAPAPTEEAQATFKAKIMDYYVVNPATIGFYARVDNTSDVTATPSCTVKFRDASYAYDGFDIFTAKKPLKGGDWFGFRGTITVTNEGAVWVTKKSIECEPE